MLYAEKSTYKFQGVGNLHTVALDRLSLAIPQWVAKNEGQLWAAATTDTFPQFTCPEPGNSQRRLVSG